MCTGDSFAVYIIHGAICREKSLGLRLFAFRSQLLLLSLDSPPHSLKQTHLRLHAYCDKKSLENCSWRARVWVGNSLLRIIPCAEAAETAKNTRCFTMTRSTILDALRQMLFQFYGFIWMFSHIASRICARSYVPSAAESLVSNAYEYRGISHALGHTKGRALQFHCPPIQCKYHGNRCSSAICNPFHFIYSIRSGRQLFYDDDACRVGKTPVFQWFSLWMWVCLCVCVEMKEGFMALSYYMRCATWCMSTSHRTNSSAIE